ncbi:MAG: glucose-6-phosphate isomerase, partial [Epsilonproteobacteria bacterium]|nr:glucose-6-phosphate isomerase [Campylobacterota bacterium]
MQNRLYFNIEHITKRDREWVFKEIEKEKEVIGYYSLPTQDIKEVIELEEKVSKEIKDIVVIGIGGSSLGSRAVYEFI